MFRKKRIYYTYHFIIDGVIIISDFTESIKEVESFYKNSEAYIIHNDKKLYWKNGIIEQVSPAPITYSEAKKWLKKNKSLIDYTDIRFDVEEYKVSPYTAYNEFFICLN